jgi:hypothetical protein
VARILAQAPEAREEWTASDDDGQRVLWVARCCDAIYRKLMGTASPQEVPEERLDRFIGFYSILSALSQLDSVEPPFKGYRTLTPEKAKDLVISLLQKNPGSSNVNQILNSTQNSEDINAPQSPPNITNPTSSILSSSPIMLPEPPFFDVDSTSVLSTSSGKKRGRSIDSMTLESRKMRRYLSEVSPSLI